MSFGVVQSGITTLKNNRNLLSKRKKLKNNLGNNSSKRLTDYNLPKSNPMVLKQLKEKIRLEHKKTTQKQLLVFCLVIIPLITLLIIYI